MTMSDTTVSQTAQRVAAYRLGFERLAAPTSEGEPDADERLAADVTAGLTVDRSSPMGRYLRARTAFFDRVVVNALGRYVAQIVVVGAGYDGRALRYGAPGVRWWEVDRSITQVDKQSRLSRLGIAADNVTFVPIDLDDGGLADALTVAGFEPDTPSLCIAEGITPYLKAETIRSLFQELRAVATVGTRLAISLRRPDADPTARAQFEAGVAALGEPAIGSLTAENAGAVLAECRWQPVELKERSRTAGFVMAAPVFAPAPEGILPTRGRIGTFVERTLYRRGGDTLAGHLEATYGVPVRRVRELDVGVHKVERAEGSIWVARVFPANRSIDAARGDSALLDWLDKAGIPAERTAAPDPVSSHEGQAVLVTEFAPGRRPAASPALFTQLGELLARIHSLPTEDPEANRPGGAWHHLLLDATPAEELTAARELLHNARHRVPRGHGADYDVLRHAAAGLELPPDLPTALVHPDFVPRNLLRTGEGDLTVVDWAGAGRGPRLVSLGCLLWSAAGHGPSVDAVARGYSSTITLEATELAHLEAAMAVRPAVLAIWTFATGRSPLPEAAAWWRGQQRKLSKAAGRARARLDTDE
jgi:methyltransferase (TIGR00027 family)